MLLFGKLDGLGGTCESSWEGAFSVIHSFIPLFIYYLFSYIRTGSLLHQLRVTSEAKWREGE